MDPFDRHEQILACLPTHAVVRRATLSAAAVRGHHGLDRLTTLPDDLRCKIVSHLPIKDAARTAVLARNNDDAEFFQNLDPIECVQSQIKKVVLHEFRGHQTEMALLRYLSQNANQMQQLTLVSLHLPDEISLGEIKGQLADLVIPPMVSEACTLLLLGPPKKLAWTFHRASDLSIHDPFLLDDGLELYRFVKEIVI